MKYRLWSFHCEIYFTMETSKKCFKCKEVKPLLDFYKHKQMSDGHLNKCKICTRKDTKIRYTELELNPKWKTNKNLQTKYIQSH